VRGLLRRALEADGWEIREAENGLVALAQLADLRPDLILLDLVMPRMDGFDFLEQVRAEGEWEGVPVVVLTGKDLGPEDQKRLEGQVEAILFKDEGQRSDHLLELRRLVRSTVERAGGDDA
jgi:CheY-like chemotaxis protein